MLKSPHLDTFFPEKKKHLSKHNNTTKKTSKGLRHCETEQHTLLDRRAHRPHRSQWIWSGTVLRFPYRRHGGTEDDAAHFFLHFRVTFLRYKASEDVGTSRARCKTQPCDIRHVWRLNPVPTCWPPTRNFHYMALAWVQWDFTWFTVSDLVTQIVRLHFWMVSLQLISGKWLGISGKSLGKGSFSFGLPSHCAYQNTSELQKLIQKKGSERYFNIWIIMWIHHFNSS